MLLPQPTYLIILILVCNFLLSGCFWSKDPEKKKNDKQVNTGITSTSAESKDGLDTDDIVGTDDEHSLSKIFSIKNKIKEIKFQYTNGQPSYALKQAEGVLPMLKPDSRERLEIYFLMARCCDKLGDKQARIRHDASFRKLLEKLGNSKEHKEKIKEGINIKKLIDESVKKSEPLREKSVFDSDEEFFNLRCFRKLRRADENKVIEEDLNDSGKIFYGKKANKVTEAASQGVGLAESDIIVQKDSQYSFYYAIIEGNQ